MMRTVCLEGGSLRPTGEPVKAGLLPDGGMVSRVFPCLVQIAELLLSVQQSLLVGSPEKQTRLGNQSDVDFSRLIAMQDAN